MEFWGEMVKPGDSILVEVGKTQIFYLTQVVLEKIIEGPGEDLHLKAVVNDKDMDLVSLHDEDFPQTRLYNVFVENFYLSHNSANCNVYFYGYKTKDLDDDEEQGSDMADMPKMEHSGNKRDGSASKITSTNKKPKTGNKSNQKSPASAADGAHSF